MTTRRLWLALSVAGAVGLVTYEFETAAVTALPVVGAPGPCKMGRGPGWVRVFVSV